MHSVGLALRVLRDGDVVDLVDGSWGYLIRRAAWSLLLFRMLELASQFFVQELAHAVFCACLIS